MAGTSNVLLGLVFFIICVSLPNANSFKIQCRMVNGQNVKTNNQFPFMVSLFDNRVRTHIFGGAIISQRHILSNTLNSYYKTKPMFVSAFIGSTRFLGKDGVIKNITDIFLHPKEDLALLKTLDDIVFTDSIKAIALPTESFNGVGEKVQMPGFGAGFAPECIQDTMHFSHQMQMHESTVFASKSCSNERYTVEDNFICTKNPLGKSICQRDSGNPLVYKNTLVGVASTDFGCSGSYPDIYTKVFEQLSWIETEMKN